MQLVQQGEFPTVVYWTLLLMFSDNLLYGMHDLAVLHKFVLHSNWNAV